MSPIDQLAEQLADAADLIFTTIVSGQDKEVRDAVADILRTQRPATVQTYADHLRLTLTDEQAAEESASRIAGEKVGEALKAELERVLK